VSAARGNAAHDPGESGRKSHRTEAVFSDSARLTTEMNACLLRDAEVDRKSLVDHESHHGTSAVN
jgi:hypothetical protein